MKKILSFLLLFFPLIAYASIAEELNSFLDFFFQPEKSAPPKEEIIDFESLEIPENVSEKDFLQLEKDIKEAQNSLENFEKIVEKNAQNIWNLQYQKQNTQKTLSQIDQQLSLITQKINKIQDQKNIWEKELIEITQDIKDTKAEIRVLEETYQNHFIRDFIRSESLSQDPSIQWVKWFFSDQTISQIIQEKNIETHKKSQQKNKISLLEKRKIFLENTESHAAKIYQYLKQLQENILHEKNVLTDLAQAKAHLLSRLESQEEKNTKEQENIVRESQETLIQLQKLRHISHVLKEKEGFGETVENSFFYPVLTPPLQVVATFKSPAYEKEFGQEHLGVDLYAPQGSDILAPVKGVVRKTHQDGYTYAYMIIDHEEDFFTVYGHLSDILVNEGQTVNPGEIIALSGGTPGTKGAGYFTTGPHLHFEVFKKGQFLDPLDFFDPEEVEMIYEED